MPEKHANTVRWGGPGASHEDRTKPIPEKREDRPPGTPTNGARSRISGGGGELDSHHTHDPRLK
jgi:hypothetical protein